MTTTLLNKAKRQLVAYKICPDATGSDDEALSAHRQVPKVPNGKQ